MTTPNSLPQVPYKRPEKNPGSSIDFADSLLSSIHIEPVPVLVSDTVAKSNKELGYEPVTPAFQQISRV